ncbi:MAG TPA: TolC family protein [Gemmatimonadaceae bacterium]|jgi:cobalt-zinc-cadmium efflux system outer membrane protein
MACLGALVVLNASSVLGAQQPLSRAEAIQTALGKSVLVTAISADTLAAAARLRSAREYPNPSLTLSYSKDAPQNHILFGVPLDLPGVRGARVRAAEAGRASARFGFLAARAAIELNVDTMYTTAQGAELRAALSHSTAVDAAKLLTDTKARRDAGDASDLDVNLAEVSAAQAANIANGDSLEAIDTRLELQAAMGLRGDTIIVELRDSLAAPRVGIAASESALATSPTIAAASAAVTAAQQTLIFERRSVVGVPSIQFGADAHDAVGGQKGLLPTVGIALPMPLFNHNAGAVEAAHAEVTRAQAGLEIARLDVSTQLARARRTRSIAESRIARDRTIMDAATSNVSMTERAYAAGEMAIGNILEARRAQHDAQAQYVTDLVSANVGAALVRVLTANGVTQ